MDKGLISTRRFIFTRENAWVTSYPPYGGQLNYLCLQGTWLTTIRAFFDCGQPVDV